MALQKPERIFPAEEIPDKEQFLALIRGLRERRVPRNLRQPRKKAAPRRQRKPAVPLPQIEIDFDFS